MADPIAAAVDALSRGEVVAYPTDTLFGLAVRADRLRALERLWEVKGRPPGLPLSVALSSTEEIESIAQLTPVARSFARLNLPGPYTLLLSWNEATRFSAKLRAADGRVGVRIPDHPVARELARRAGPITATSANRHGHPTPSTVGALRRIFGDSVSAYLSDGPPPTGRPSQIVDLTGARPRYVDRRPSGGAR
jgi:L-threonylcarbamoyladenylate synthase